MTDFTRHNVEVEQVWAAYLAGRPIRTPMQLTSVQRIWVLDPQLNTRGITWQAYLNDPEIMFEVSLQHRYHVAHTIPQDLEMGIPAKNWNIGLEFGNVYEENWLGCEIIYPEGQIASTRPRYAGKDLGLLLDAPPPGPFDGFMGRVMEYYEYCVEKARSYEFHRRPVHVGLPVPLGTDGPLTVANGIRGAQVFEDMLSNEDEYHRLMSYVTDAIIQRILAWRSRLGLEAKPECGGFADDAVQFVSTRLYVEKVLPYHRRLVAALYGAGPHSIHLCGNVQRHFPTLVRELNIKSFDTGFPIDFTKLREQLGEDVEIQGGVPVGVLMSSTPQEVFDLTRSILESGIRRGGKFILKEANDLAPCVPVGNMQAMYRACREFGRYPQQSQAG